LIQEVRKRFPKVKCILHTGASAAVPRAGAAERSWNLDIPILFKPCSNEIVRELVGGVLEL
ncbi:MAG TPA: hypothetical protein VEY30_01195, partial [Myxococcaceae bacterium]|nr:hypothetical protein [Myxococcaceae bacterium]